MGTLVRPWFKLRHLSSRDEFIQPPRAGAASSKYRQNTHKVQEVADSLFYSDLTLKDINQWRCYFNLFKQKKTTHREWFFLKKH